MHFVWNTTRLYSNIRHTHTHTKSPLICNIKGSLNKMLECNAIRYRIIADLAKGAASRLNDHIALKQNRHLINRSRIIKHINRSQTMPLALMDLNRRKLLINDVVVVVFVIVIFISDLCISKKWPKWILNLSSHLFLWLSNEQFSAVMNKRIYYVWQLYLVENWVIGQQWKVLSLRGLYDECWRKISVLKLISICLLSSSSSPLSPVAVCCKAKNQSTTQLKLNEHFFFMKY